MIYCVQPSSGIVPQRASLTTHSQTPDTSEEHDEPYPQPAWRANAMKVVAAAESPPLLSSSVLVKRQSGSLVQPQSGLVQQIKVVARALSWRRTG
ncbi:hypothetical protein [Mycobacterium shimoidei]|uniref:hypothetical protein n=1 Tax=Mycobacterium shimoidei TaxID=29313 RepID=UPI000848A418|nr:hypothetical protein [Mycobacterium shimoidei]MCV7258705.1 hypothetical protein [Mycobacterium shimoidei]ODR15377.1 hypothetical protein BHQ16_01165 [Mycobacterium shimoidei]ORW79955.1 hypothetical protein AWC26_13760 [Mycobacterium shimoidei]